MDPRFEPPAYQARVIELIHQVAAWMQDGADPAAAPADVAIVAHGSSTGPFDAPCPSRSARPVGPEGPPTRVDCAVFEVRVNDGLLVVTAFAEPSEEWPDLGSGGWGGPTEGSLLDVRRRPVAPDGALLQPVGGGSTPGCWRADAVQLRADVAEVTIGGTPVPVPAHGVVLALGGDRHPPVLDLRDGTGARLWAGSITDALDDLRRTGAWPT